MKEALLYDQLSDKKVKCNLCNWHCTILPDKQGTCGVRKNVDGKLYSLVYGKPCSIAVDPIEKKPLFHFLPGEAILSIGTSGCNFFCLGCQNYDISQGKFDENDFKAVSPEEIISETKAKDCKMIAFTYNEPTIFYEYFIDIAKLAKNEGIKTVMVSNGYMTEKALNEILKYIDAINVDLKSFSEDFYRNYCKTKLKPVLDNLKRMKGKTWLEITNLVIPGMDDKPEEIEEMCKWIKENVGDVPLHFSRFFPMYKATGKDVTPLKTLLKAKEIADKYLSYIYIGNIETEKGENTYCPKCKALLIERRRYVITKNVVKDGKCPECGFKISGVWP